MPNKAPYALLITTLFFTLAGLTHYLNFIDHETAQLSWMISGVLVLSILLIEIFRSLIKGNFGVDLIAAIAIVGALLLGEHLTAAVIALMYTGGQALENYAANRAKRELTALINRTPATAERYDQDSLTTVKVEDIKPGDKLLIKTGSVLPVDGYIDQGFATLDESALTGESLPVKRTEGQTVTSGTVNIAQPFDLIVAHDAASSTYANIVRLVQEAQTSKTPFTRMADRYALWLIPFTLLVAGLAWLWSGDPIRALAVLVVATPCPLILAAPIAIVSGISTAARQGLLIKNGAALEALANTQRIILDKTGTLTNGNPRLVDIETDGSMSKEQLLQLAASVEQASFHVISDSIVESAKQRQLKLHIPQQVTESAGNGLQGCINQQQVMIGQAEWVIQQTQLNEWVQSLLERNKNQASMIVLVALDQYIRGALLLQDEIRADTPRALRSLRATGINSISMASGDQQAIADSIGNVLGIDKIYAELKPEDKVKVVRAEREYGITLMVGDGVNDAPALAIADIGVAMGAHGAGASSEAADAVLMVDRLESLANGLLIARYSQKIARQSVMAGMGLSAVAMMFAAMGYLTPLAGALVQEGIDVLVILNALRVLGFRITRHPIISQQQQQLLYQTHVELQPTLDSIRQLADHLALPPTPSEVQTNIIPSLNSLAQQLQQKIIPHEQSDERELHPGLARKMTGSDPLAMLSRTHSEILQLANQFNHQLELLNDTQPNDQQRQNLVRILYSLSAILELHFAQENELYSMLAGENDENKILTH
ncbi:heavy metal translocating P-type ATPase [Thiomicrospira pelophila]|uniref:heavy metal translocating P-type ATPase n=1 Tax=Thiomicrospira pelophila TaxID=934 RepID=UPI0006909F47|nr:heavy metal translocating P-type ATPase [Thiomicrospira pelophila]